MFYFWQQRFKLFTKCWQILSLSSFSTEDKTNQKLPAIDLAITIGLKYWKVGWLRADDQTILSLHRRVVTHNPRVSVTHDESRTWNLHIRQVKESDQGCYMCQVIIGAFPFVFISRNCFNCRRCTSTQFCTSWRSQLVNMGSPQINLANNYWSFNWVLIAYKL